MARYIDADILRKNEVARCHCVPCVGSNDNNYKDLDEVLNDCPTADVVEVVMCAHCQHLLKEIVVESTPYGFENEKTSFGCKRALDLTGEWVDVMLDGFCSCGERKE